MEENSNILFKATNNGLILVMDEKDDIEDIYHKVEKKMAAAGKFFKGASLVVKYRGKKLTKEEEEKICRLISEKSEAEVVLFEADKDFETKTTQHEIQIEESEKSATSKPSYQSGFYFKGIEEGITKFYRGTVRSGQLISFNGNVVILGDVNPGAEIVAAGNIIILGNLRGIVHAGFDGNKEAVIAALNLQPLQLRIANIIARPPDEDRGRDGIIPEVAYIKDENIYIERFLPQR